MASVRLQLLGRRAVARRQVTGLLYRVESWLFMSPLKCSNFFSVSSLKEPPEGQASGRESLVNQSPPPLGGLLGSPLCDAPRAALASASIWPGMCQVLCQSGAYTWLRTAGAFHFRWHEG